VISTSDFVQAVISTSEQLCHTCAVSSHCNDTRRKVQKIGTVL
jgi:hypothetical protein